MPKRAMSFKPTPECEVQLAELMGRWGCDRTAVLIMAVDVAHKTLMVGTEPKILPKDPKEAAAVVAKKAKPAISTVSKEPHFKDTRTQQEKLDDFYRLNMAKWKK